jgi:hypothetical protein
MGEPDQALARGFASALPDGPLKFRVLMDRARALEKIGSRDAARAAWQDLLAEAAAAERDHCPEWIRVIAEASVARLQPLPLVPSRTI